MSRRGIGIPAAALLAGLLVTPSPGGDLEGRRIGQVRFDPPSQPYGLNELREIVAIRAGDNLSMQAVRQSIENLFATGRYQDIVVDAQESGGELIVTFQTINRWFIGRQTVEGVKEPPSVTQLLNSTKLSLGQEYTEGRLTQAVGNMRTLLSANGLYEAKVDTNIERDPETEQTEVQFEVEPGPRARFSDPILRGTTSRTPKDIIKATGWKRWWGLGGYKPVTENRVENGIQKIRRSLEKKDFLLSRVTLLGMEWKPESKVAVPTIEIEDGQRVDLEIKGVRLSKAQRRSLIPIYQERSVDRELLNEGSANLEAYFEARGYFDASADYIQIEEPKRQVVEYTVDRGPRYQLSKVDITGNKYFDARTLRERLSIIPATPIRYRHGRFSERLLQNDQNTILGLYHDNGFLDAKVEPTVDAGAPGKERHQTVTLAVEEGPQYLISKLEITGINEETETRIRDNMQSVEGQPYSEQNIQMDRETVLNIYFNQGFTEATFDYTARPGTAPHTVDVKVEIREGRQQFVRRILVRGIEKTDPKLVYSRISLRPGDPLSLGQMLESQKRLYDLGIFARVETAIQNPQGLESSKYVLFEVEEAKKWSFNVGVGAQVGRIGGGNLQSLDSPAGATGFSPRVNLGLARNNLLGLGHTLSFQGRVSNIQQRVQTTYLAPHFRDQESLSLAISGLYDQSADVRTFASLRLEAAIQLTKRLSRANTLQGRYAIRRVKVDPETLKIEPLLIPLLSQPVRIGIVSTTFIQDRRDDPLNSTRGFYNSVDVGLASPYLGSQSNFFRLIGRNSSYYKIGREIVFARTLTFGIQERLTGGPLKDVPLPERFFAGGASSHRGFPENQAGPRDLETGFPLGGKALMIFGHELRYPLIGDNLGAVLFHDMGNVYSRVGTLSFRYQQRDLQDFNYMVQTVGLGFRYRTPIGPIRVDLAFSPNSPRFFGCDGTRDELVFTGCVNQRELRINQFQFHFSLGQTF